MNYTNDELNSLIIEWIEINQKKNSHARKQEYEKAVITRDNERIIERKIIHLSNLSNIDSFHVRVHVRNYAKAYLENIHGIDLDGIDLDNIKETIREIKLNKLGI